MPDTPSGTPAADHERGVREARKAVLVAADAWARGDNPTLGLQARADLYGEQQRTFDEALAAYEAAIESRVRDEGRGA